MSPKVEQTLYRTLDPHNQAFGGPVSALTTMLFKVCGQDQTKFEEACRLIELFIEEALKP